MKSHPRIAAHHAQAPVPRSSGDLSNSRFPDVIAAHVVDTTSAVDATAVTARPAWALPKTGPTGARSPGVDGGPLSDPGQLLLHGAHLGAGPSAVRGAGRP